MGKTATKETKESTYEIAKIGTTALAVPTGLEGAWGSDIAEAKDMPPTRIHLAQKMSEVVDTHDIKAGQFYRSTDKTVLGSEKKPMETLIVHSFKNVVIEAKKGEKFEFETIRPYLPIEASLPWEFTEDGVEKRRSEQFNYFVLLTEDLAKNEAIPHLLSFRRTSAVCAKTITGYMIKMKQFNCPACTYVLEFTSTLKTNDMGSYHIPQMKQGRKATVEEMTQCRQWFEAISAGAIKVENVDAETGEVS